MKLKLDAAVASPQDLRAVILELRGYAAWFGRNAVKLKVHAHNTAPAPVLTRPASAVLHAWDDGKAPTQASLDGLLAALSDYEAHAPQLTITLAAPAPGSVKQELVGWCRDNLTPNVLVNFQFNSSLLGGLVVRSGSHVFDWSFRRQIMASREQFPEILRRV